MNDSVFLPIPQKFREGMSEDELYEAARGEWDSIPAHIKYALPVVRNEVKDVYEIDPKKWEQVGDKWRFGGVFASEMIRNRCRGRQPKNIRSFGTYFYGNLEEQFPLEHQNPPREDSMTKTAIELLRQFYQIIFYGPPGTGKTRAAKQVLKSIFGLGENDDAGLQKLQDGEDSRWDIVQFHPSYNYEDFVRGIQAEPVDGKVAYEMVDRIFGDMCRKANAAPDDKKFALIIDEINRANVSAVLGELIYALEYRGEKVATPYTVDNKKELVIPKNLYVIGTMNTADRTIGQIDYAVRRRFAFINCPPKREVLELEKSNGSVLDIYDDVQGLFDKSEGGFLSSDFDADDVCIGHSYFLADKARTDDIPSLHQISRKIVRQVVPILREYIKDGVLHQDAESEIKKIKEAAEELLDNESAESDSSLRHTNAEQPQSQYPGNFIFKWTTPDGRHGFNGMGNTTLAVVKDYAEHRNPANKEALLSALSLPERALKKVSDGILNSCFMDESDRINFPDDDQAVVSFQWTNNPKNKPWGKFTASAETLGYQIRACRFVNVGEGDSRSWADCYKYGFVAAGGKFKDGSEGFRKQIENLQVGDAVFAYWGGDGVSEKRRGFVALGTVLETAVRIDKFMVGEQPLSKCKSEKGGSYEDAYPRAFAIGRDAFDYAVRVKWEKVLDEGDIVDIKWNENVVSSRVNRFDRLRKAFNLGNEGED